MIATVEHLVRMEKLPTGRTLTNDVLVAGAVDHFLSMDVKERERILLEFAPRYEAMIEADYAPRDIHGQQVGEPRAKRGRRPKL
jgi:hypothetical protein